MTIITVEKIEDDDGVAILMNAGYDKEMRIDLFPPNDEVAEPYIGLPSSIFARHAPEYAALLMRAFVMCQVVEPSYDCRTTGERIAVLEQRVDDLTLRAVSETTHIGLMKRVAALETKNASATVHLEQIPNLVARVAALEGKRQPLSAVDALRQIANIQARDPNGLKMTWSEIALTCIDIARKALDHDATPNP